MGVFVWVGGGQRTASRRLLFTVGSGDLAQSLSLCGSAPEPPDPPNALSLNVVNNLILQS